MNRSHVVITNWKDGAHPEAGGAEVYCEAIARELVELGFRVTLLTSRPAGLPARSEVDGYTVRRMGSTYTVYALALFWLLRHRRDIDAAIDSQNGIPFFSPLALRRATSIVLLIHHVHQDQFGMYFSPSVARIGKWLERTGSRWVYGRRAVAAVSPSSRTEIRKRLGLKGAVHVVPNGSTPPAGPVVPRAAAPTIACVGRLVPHKRWHLLLDLAARVRVDVPDLHVDLIGSGSEAAALKDQVARLGLEDTVTLHGYLAVEERDRLLGRSWLTVSTSVGEGWGLSVIEAAAQGVPAVALDVPGLRDSVRPGVTGWLAADGGDELGATVRAALELLAEPAIAERYADRCRRWAESLTWAAGAARFHAIFADEAARLGDRLTTRTRDIATVAVLDAEAALLFDPTVLRPTDQTTFCPACLSRSGGSLDAHPTRLLLLGRDERDALDLLAQGGLSGLSDEAHRVELSVCRPHELLSWAGDGTPHSYMSIASGLRCPTPSARGPVPQQVRATAVVGSAS